MAERLVLARGPLETRLPCPVCTVLMEKARVTTRQWPVTLDHCPRCGGVWFERGETQQIAAAKPAELWSAIAPRSGIPHPPCRNCGIPLDRDAERCAACGRANVLSCPYCDRAMKRRATQGLVLDYCESCKGVWFDNTELSAIWTLYLAAQPRRRPPRAGEALAVGGDVLLDAMFWTPGLVADGAVGLAHVGAAAFEVAGQAAESIFEVIVSLISSIFGGS